MNKVYLSDYITSFGYPEIDIIDIKENSDSEFVVSSYKCMALMRTIDISINQYEKVIQINSLSYLSLILSLKKLQKLLFVSLFRDI